MKPPINTINEVRQQGLKLTKKINGRIAVIVLTAIDEKKEIYVIQFWTREMIELGTRKNNDNTMSKFVEIL